MMRLLLLGGNSLGLEHTLDNVGLLDQEGSGDPTNEEQGDRDQRLVRPVDSEIGGQRRRDSPVLDTPGTPRSTVSPLDGLLPLGEGSVLPRPESGDTGKSESTVTTLGSVLSIVHAEAGSGQVAEVFPIFSSTPPGGDSRPTSSSGERPTFHRGS